MNPVCMRQTWVQATLYTYWWLLTWRWPWSLLLCYPSDIRYFNQTNNGVYASLSKFNVKCLNFCITSIQSRKQENCYSIIDLCNVWKITSPMSVEWSCLNSFLLLILLISVTMTDILNIFAFSCVHFAVTVLT